MKLTLLGSVKLNYECVLFYSYYGVVSMVPIFQYSNAYATTPKLRRLAVDKRLQEECIKTVAVSGRQPCI